MARFYDQAHDAKGALSLRASAKAFNLTNAELFLISSIYKAENGGFKLVVTNHKHDPGGLTVAGMTVKNNPELRIWNDVGPYEQLLILIAVYKKYIEKVSNAVDPRLRFILAHANFVGFDTVISTIQQFLKNTGTKIKVDGVYGPKTEQALIDMTASRSDLFDYIAAAIPINSHTEAQQVMNAQKSLGLVTKDLTAGYENRMFAALKDSLNVTSVA